MSQPSKISVYSIPDLKNTTDDALPNYLNSLNFKQSHYYTDIRLALGYSAVVIAGVLFYFDWKLGWEQTRDWTLGAVVAYFILNGAFTYWLLWVEKGIVYVGERSGTKLVISTTTEKNSPTYNVTARFTSSKNKSDGRWKQIQVKTAFSRWFSSDGFFVPKPFQQWLASEISVIGEADPTNVVEDIGRGSAPVTSISGSMQSMNVGIDNLEDVLNHLKTQGQGSGKARRRG